MVKTSHKNFVKKERSKVKLKGKKVLPKGLNTTDTSFKVKKIVVKEQLKEHGPSEILSRRKLNIKELVSRLNHHNVSMRQESLNGLKEVVEHYPKESLKRHLPELIEAAAYLTIDRETAIRTDALKLLSAVLDQVSVEEMLPLFTILSSYLICAMTHIELPIREGSLKLLDTLLRAMPQLVASQADLLLPRFLDLISEKRGANRTLSLHLEGKMSTEKWRAQVLFRLQKLLTSIKDYSKLKDIFKGKENERTQEMFLKWEKNTKLFAAIYTDIYFQVTTFSFGEFESNAPSLINEPKLKLQEYAEILIPLLLATFIEVAPYKQNDEEKNQHQISVEAAVLLQCIVDIILTLWELIQQADDRESTLLWFRRMYTDSICKRLVGERFPYSTSQLQEKIVNKKFKKEVKALLSAEEGTQNIDGQCLMQNLGISRLVLLLTESKYKIRLVVVDYLKNCLRNCGTLNTEQCTLLQSCLEAACVTSKAIDSTSLIKSVTSCWNRYKALDRPFSVMLFDFLTGIALNHKLEYLQREETFEVWLDALPELLTLPKINYSTIKKISQIATRSIPAFSQSLDGWIEAILDNVPIIQIEECTEEEVRSGKRDIISLLYWVKDWDEEMIDNFQRGISNSFFGDLTSHLVDILHMRAQNDPEGIVSSQLSKKQLL